MYRLSQREFESHYFTRKLKISFRPTNIAQLWISENFLSGLFTWSPMYRFVTFLVPLIRRLYPDCELNVLVLRGAMIHGCDHGPLSLSARKATTSVSTLRVSVLCLW